MIKNYKDLDVYKSAYSLALNIHNSTLEFLNLKHMN